MLQCDLFGTCRICEGCACGRSDDGQNGSNRWRVDAIVSLFFLFPLNQYSVGYTIEILNSPLTSRHRQVISHQNGYRPDSISLRKGEHSSSFIPSPFRHDGFQLMSPSFIGDLIPKITNSIATQKTEICTASEINKGTSNCATQFTNSIP